MDDRWDEQWGRHAWWADEPPSGGACWKWVPDEAGQEDLAQPADAWSPPAQSTQQPAPAATSKTGVIKFFDSSRGFGFITQDDGGPEIYAGLNGFSGEPLRAGDVVEYDQVQGNMRDSRPRAMNITGLAGGGGGARPGGHGHAKSGANDKGRGGGSESVHKGKRICFAAAGPAADDTRPGGAPPRGLPCEPEPAGGGEGRGPATSVGIPGPAASGAYRHPWLQGEALGPARGPPLPEARMEPDTGSQPAEESGNRVRAAGTEPKGWHATAPLRAPTGKKVASEVAAWEATGRGAEYAAVKRRRCSPGGAWPELLRPLAPGLVGTGDYGRAGGAPLPTGPEGDPNDYPVYPGGYREGDVRSYRQELLADTGSCAKTWPPGSAAGATGWCTTEPMWEQ
jgi:cold shock CspA family protein